MFIPQLLLIHLLLSFGFSCLVLCNLGNFILPLGLFEIRFVDLLLPGLELVVSVSLFDSLHALVLRLTVGKPLLLLIYTVHEAILLVILDQLVVEQSHLNREFSTKRLLL